MRILITVLLFLRVLDAAPTLLAHTSAHAQYTFSTSAIDTTGATLIVVAAGSYNGYSVALSDSQSNSWTALPSQMNSNERLTLYYCLLPATSSSHIFTLTGGAPYGSLVVEAWNGISGVDVSTGNNVGDSINTYQIGPILPAKNGDLVVAALLANFQYAPPLGISIDSGYTITDTTQFTANNASVSMAYLAQDTVASTNPTWSALYPVMLDLCGTIVAFQPISTASIRIHHKVTQ